MGFKVASSPQMENTLFHKPTFLFTFHQSCLQHSALQVRDSWGEPSVKRREGSELGHLNSLSEIKQRNSSNRHSKSVKSKMLLTLMFCSSAKWSYDFQSCIEPPKKAVFPLGIVKYPAMAYSSFNQ